MEKYSKGLGSVLRNSNAQKQAKSHHIVGIPIIFFFDGSLKILAGFLRIFLYTPSIVEVDADFIPEAGLSPFGCLKSPVVCLFPFLRLFPRSLA